MLQEKKIAKLSLLSKTLLASERAKAIAKGDKKEELHDNNSNSATEVTFVSSSKYNENQFDELTTIFEYLGNYKTFLEHFRSCLQKRLLQRRPKLHLKAKCHRKLLRLRILQSHF